MNFRRRHDETGDDRRVSVLDVALCAWFIAMLALIPIVAGVVFFVDPASK